METQKLFPGKLFISQVLDMLEYKSEMTGQTKRRYLMRAAMAGVIVGFFYVGNYTIQAGMDAIDLGAQEDLLPIGRMLGSAFFGFALVFIYFSKSELLTSNMMIISIGHYFRRVSARASSRVLGLCYLGNFLGGLALAGMIALSSIISVEAMGLMEESVAHKLAYITDGPSGWVDLFVRAVFCNFFINLAMLMAYNGSIKEDLMKAIAMIAAVFVFAYLGFEHSVANTVLFSVVGLQEGLDLLPAAGNIAIALLGNFVGGGILIGVYYAYLNDEAGYMRRHPELRQGGGAT
ncbi:MAG: formate/nitrite transporter family protein [Candidatus Nanopelagicales bacterium]|nr:formate/nitrite transporter family protein [Candidatus Nanopelagicales bacterium]